MTRVHLSYFDGRTMLCMDKDGIADKDERRVVSHST